MSRDYALTTVVCPGCSQPMEMRADVLVDEDGDRVLDTDMIDRGLLLHLRLSCHGVARYAVAGPEPELFVEDDPVVIDEDHEP